LAVNLTLSAFTAERRRLLWRRLAVAAQRQRLLHGATDGYLLPTGRSAANMLHAAAAVDQWDRRTLGCFIDPGPRTMRALSITTQ